MDLRQTIQETFGESVFSRPLFYAYPNGLRFDLSGSGGTVEMFLGALDKALRICKAVFTEESLVICLRAHSSTNAFSHRPIIAGLKDAGISIPPDRNLWAELIQPDDWFCETSPEYWVHLAFKAPVAQLRTFLWLALAQDLGSIEPKVRCDIYLFNLEEGIVAFPYDDRGMDVVGPNTKRLSTLYRTQGAFLLDHDRSIMDNRFGGSGNTPQ